MAVWLKRHSAYLGFSSSEGGCGGRGAGSCGAVLEAGSDSLEVVASVETPGKAGEVGLGMVGAELAVDPGDRAPDGGKDRIDPFERRLTSSLGSRSDVDRAMALGSLA